MSKVIGIIGSRRRNTEADYLLTRAAFINVAEPGDTIVSGGCPKGGDKFAERIAFSHRVPIHIHRAEWDTYGKSAGFKRNHLIARDADILIACVAPDRTGGTEHTIKVFLNMHPTGKVVLV